jgi:hypothetical protein
MQLKIVLFGAVMIASIAVVSPAKAVTTYTDLSAWQADVGSFSREPSYGTDSTDISTLTLSDGTSFGLSPAVEIRTVPSSWGTWSGGYTGQVLYSPGATSVTGSFSTATSAFGFFSEPNAFTTLLFTLLLSDGSSVSGSFAGQAGAGFLGWVGPGITSFTISTTDNFAFGDFYSTTAVPAPAVGAGLPALLALGGFVWARRRKAIPNGRRNGTS